MFVRTMLVGHDRPIKTVRYRLCAARRTGRVLLVLIVALGLRNSAVVAQQTVPLISGTGDTLRLTLDAARSRALSQNPDLATARVDVDIARGQLRQASSIRTHPSFDVLSAGARGNQTELSLTQEVEIAGQRGLRRRGAQAEVSRSTLTTANAARLITADVDRAFYQVFAAGRRADLSQEILALNERLSEVAGRQLREGEISKLDYNLAVIELGRSRARAIAALREREGAELELRRLLGFDHRVTIQPIVDSTHRHVRLDSAGAVVRVEDQLSVGNTPLSELIARGLVRRADLRARDAQVDRAAAEMNLARREALPNLTLRIATEAAANARGTAVRPGVGITLPVLNRKRGEIDAREAAVRQAQADRNAVAQRIRAEVESAARAYNSAASEVEVLEATVLAPARENRQLLEAAYREGKVGLAVLLLIRNQVIDAEQEYWSAWLAEREALSALAAATGDNGVPATGDSK